MWKLDATNILTYVTVGCDDQRHQFDLRQNSSFINQKFIDEALAHAFMHSCNDGLICAALNVIELVPREVSKALKFISCH